MLSPPRTMQPLERAVAKAIARRAELRAAAEQTAREALGQAEPEATDEVVEQVGEQVGEEAVEPTTEELIAQVKARFERIPVSFPASPPAATPTSGAPNPRENAQSATSAVEPEVAQASLSAGPATANEITDKDQQDSPAVPATEAAAAATKVASEPAVSAEGPQDAFTLLLSSSAAGTPKKKRDAPSIRNPKQRIKALSPSGDGEPNRNAEGANQSIEVDAGNTGKKPSKPSLRSWFSPKQDPNPPPPPTRDPSLDDSSG